MAKLVFGQRPESFKSKVEVPLLDGTTAEIVFTFRSRARKEYARMLDEHNAEVRKQAAAKGEEPPALESLVGFNIDTDVKLILKCAEGWDLEDEFNHANIVRLLDEHGGAGQRVVECYREAINEGRVKN